MKPWLEEGTPKDTVYHCPPRGEVVSPAPARIASPIYAQATAPKMIAKCTVEGKSIDQAIDSAAAKLEGFARS